MFSEFFIKRPIFATVLSAIIIIAGIISIKGLPIEEYPEVIPPQVSVMATYSGANAETIAKKVRNMHEDGIIFSPAAQQELKQLRALVLEACTKSLAALENDDRLLAQDALDITRQVKISQKEMRKNHVNRLNEKVCDPLSGFVMLELLINMKRVSDHSKNISQLVLGEF